MKPDHQSKLAAGNIQFHQWCAPPIPPGDYTVQVKQSVAELKGEGENLFNQNFSFSVAGPRFSLAPTDVYSVYPPKGYTGDFSDTLPHIVFTRRTLPWERTIDLANPEQSDDCPPPWMALLTVSATDFDENKIPTIRSLPIRELIKLDSEQAIVGPKLTLASYENENDHCNTIDLSGKLFQAIAPTKAELKLLAHVREVNTGHKETSSFLADGWFSVSVGNRFPEAERKIEGEETYPVESRVFLVSLEGLGDYLSGEGNDLTNKNVRLAVLSSWSFRCKKAFSFKADMDKLDVKLLRVPWPDKREPPVNNAGEQQIYDAWFMGYTGLNHSARNGQKAVSWYRGPLVPMPRDLQDNYIARLAADAALRYNSEDGMMDVSYAAAYQLGRLLALQDRHFTTVLYNYRTKVQQQIAQHLSKKRMESNFANIESSADSEVGLMKDYLNQFTHSAKVSSWQEKSFSLKDPESDDSISNAQPVSLTDLDLTIPTSVCDWLAKLILLYKVPFTNLVPDKRMLPPDSIRFFYLDPDWIKCLLEGACSVGRSNTQDEIVDKNLRDKFLSFSMEMAMGVRTKPALIKSLKLEKGKLLATTNEPHGLNNNDSIIISDILPPYDQLNCKHVIRVVDDTNFTFNNPESNPLPIDASKQTIEGGSFVRSSLTEINIAEDSKLTPNWPLTGFLLRSSVVEGWQGLEMRAWSKGYKEFGMKHWHDNQEKDEALLKPLRIDRLAPDIMLCIFNASEEHSGVKRIEIKQPPEGMHFGAALDKKNATYSKKHLRSLIAVGDYAPGDQLEENSETSVPLRNIDGSIKVVDISNLADKLKETLDKNGISARDKALPFTSADFGVQMVESPGRVIFDIDIDPHADE